MNNLKRYVPQLVQNEISKLEYKNKEHLYVVCDMISRISIYRKEDTNYSNNFTDIPRSYLQDIISDNNYLTNSIQFLLENDIIECDGISKVGVKSLGYRFKDSLISKLIPVEIKSLVIKRNIINNRNSRNNSVNKVYKKYKKHFMDTFKIDYDKALNYINNQLEESIQQLNNQYQSFNTFLCGRKVNSSQSGQGFTDDQYRKEWIKLTNKYNHLFISISAINDGNLFFRKNKTNGRIDTNLTNLKSELKQFIITDNPTIQIDITNSQPYILNLTLFNTFLCGRKVNSSQSGQGLTDDLFLKEIEKYNNWTSNGTYYENFQNEYYYKTSKMLERKEIKDLMFCIFYSKNNTYLKEKNIFKSIFPNVYNYIKEEKKNKHNEFAIKMQKLESDICIDTICPLLDNENIKYYTIHDAWLVDKKDEKRTLEIIKNTFMDRFNSVPNLKSEFIN